MEVFFFDRENPGKNLWIDVASVSVSFFILRRTISLETHPNYSEDICLQTFFCYLNVQNVKQKNSLLHQPIILCLAY